MKGAVFVTGVAGFIGSHVAERFLSAGYQVIGLDNFDDFYPPTLKMENVRGLVAQERFCLVRGDVRDQALLARLFSRNGVHVVVHLAARAGVRHSLDKPLLYQDVNVGGTVSLLQASHTHGVRRLIVASTSSVYGDGNKGLPSEESDPLRPISPYAASKAAAELFCRTYSHLYGLQIIALRFFTVYGPRQRPEMAVHRFVKMVDRGEEVILFGDGTSRRDYTYISDIVEGVVQSAAYSGQGFEAFNLGSSNPVALEYLISLIEQALGKRARVRKQPMQVGDVSVTHADISKAEDLLGYHPKITIEQGIPRFVEWYRGRRGEP